MGTVVVRSTILSFFKLTTPELEEEKPFRDFKSSSPRGDWMFCSQSPCLLCVSAACVYFFAPNKLLVLSAVFDGSLVLLGVLGIFPAL